MQSDIKIKELNTLIVCQFDSSGPIVQVNAIVISNFITKTLPVLSYIIYLKTRPTATPSDLSTNVPNTSGFCVFYRLIGKIMIWENAEKVRGNIGYYLTRSYIPHQ